MKKFNVKKFLGLFDNFYANETEIWAMLNDMDEDALSQVKHECEKDLAKYYGVYDSTINMWEMSKEV